MWDVRCEKGGLSKEPSGTLISHISHPMSPNSQSEIVLRTPTLRAGSQFRNYLLDFHHDSFWIFNEFFNAHQEGHCLAPVHHAMVIG